MRWHGGLVRIVNCMQIIEIPGQIIDRKAPCDPARGAVERGHGGLADCWG